VRGSIDLVERKLHSHAEAEAILRKAGYSQEQIDSVLRDIPDPIDVDRDADAFMRHGITRDSLISRAGGSP
jgi:CBS-domain-containing membrane protein